MDLNNTDRWLHHSNDPYNRADNDIPSVRYYSHSMSHHSSKVRHNIGLIDPAIECDNVFPHNHAGNGIRSRWYHFVVRIVLDEDMVIVDMYLLVHIGLLNVVFVCRSSRCSHPYTHNDVPENKLNQAISHNHSVERMHYEISHND